LMSTDRKTGGKMGGGTVPSAIMQPCMTFGGEDQLDIVRRQS
jgi:hypothetical protein